MNTPRILFALPGLHRVNRGAEAAFAQIAKGLCEEGFDVTLIGAGEPIEGRPYRFLQGSLRTREAFRKWPSIPPFRGAYRWEEASFVPSLWKLYKPAEYDITVTCSYPFVNWVLRAKRKGKTPKHVYITENSDWAVHTPNREYRWFGCEGLVCTNPEYYQRNRETWNATLIPNGVDVSRFTPGEAPRAEFGLPAGAKVVCMVSALIPSKYPMDGVRAVAEMDGVHLLLAGDGPQREECDALGKELLGDRYHRITVPMEKMPLVYRCGDVFLHLSRAEAFGNIYIEAMSCGIPVVAHDTPTTEWILGEHGRRLDTSDRPALVSMLQEMLAQPVEESTRSKMHEFAAERFDWPVVCRRYAEWFRGLVTT